ncbi:Uncharacterised protein [Amycolatopsis camponoti]|uniref:Uncharacterized protein n=1 Tax=Amycolatopsis camponoti TaxID=2606593 RepID=A0A6I8LZF6_9PSEU|nr:hypothetical protein [Amycolatopsis camponoti]VVJ22695.1 Uncharacterised protein [Amycolatopsis camponoti]
MTAPRFVDERVATNGEHHMLERLYHHGPDTLRVQVVRDLHSAARSRAITERLDRRRWVLLAELPAQDWYYATAACTLATTTSVLGGVAGRVLQQALRTHVAGTVIGAHFEDTAGIDLPQLAVWLTAEVTALLRDHLDPVWQRVRCATVARLTPREIRVNLHGLDASGECERWEPSETDQRVLDDIWQLAEQHNWHRGDERRFDLVLHVVTGRSAARMFALGERPGTICTEP